MPHNYIPLVPNDFTNLPPLTHDQTRVVGAYLSAYGTLIEASADAGMTLGAFLDHLAAPEVQAHITHANRMARERAEHYLAESAYAATHTLRVLAENLDADPTERRRAASILLRAHGINTRPTARRPKPTASDINPLADALRRLENVDAGSNAGDTPSVVVDDSNDTSPAGRGRMQKQTHGHHAFVRPFRRAHPNPPPAPHPPPPWRGRCHTRSRV